MNTERVRPLSSDFLLYIYHLTLHCAGSSLKCGISYLNLRGVGDIVYLRHASVVFLDFGCNVPYLPHISQL